MAKKSRKLLKKQTKASKSGLTKKKQTLMDRLPENEIEYTELLIAMTERRIKPDSKDTIWTEQKARLLAKLDVLTKKG